MSERSARLLVVGDTGVGKTSVVHLLREGTVLRTPTWTVGCAVSAMLHENERGSLSAAAPGGPSFVEFWDVGGQKKYALSRRMFYRGAHGIILVYAANNKRSYLNLRQWLAETADAAGVAEDDAGGIGGGGGGGGGAGAGVVHAGSTYGGHGGMAGASDGGGGGIRMRAGSSLGGDYGSAFGDSPSAGAAATAAAATGGRGRQIPLLLVANKADLATVRDEAARAALPPLPGLAARKCETMSMSARDPSSVPWEQWRAFVGRALAVSHHS